MAAVKIPVTMFSKLLLLLLLVFPAFPHDEHVLQLTDNNFSKIRSRYKNLVVMYFVPWSGLCQKFRPHYARAAKFMVDNNLPIVVGKMDCSGLGKQTCEQQQLAFRLPAIYFYQNGALITEYRSSKDSFSLIKFMKAQIMPAAVELKSVDEFKEFLKKQIDVVIVGFFEQESLLKRMFMRVAEEWKEFITFAFSQCEKLLMREGVLNGIVLFRPNNIFNRYEEERVLFSGRVIIGEIKNFIVNNYYGLIFLRNPTNMQNFVKPYIVLYYTSDPRGEGNEVTYWRSRLMKIAYKYRTKIKMGISAKEDFEEELSDFSVDFNNKMHPFVLGVDLENQKYIMTENFTSKTFETFVDDFVNNRLVPVIKSAPITYSNDSVIIAVANNFDEIVMKNNRDTFLDLYAPWSVGSNKFASLLRKVADLLQDEDIVIVKMDTSENQVPELFADKVLPGSYFLGKNSKNEPVSYQGPWTVQNIIQFIAKLASKEMVHFDKNGLAKLVNEEL